MTSKQKREALKKKFRNKRKRTQRMRREKRYWPVLQAIHKYVGAYLDEILVPYLVTYTGIKVVFEVAPGFDNLERKRKARNARKIRKIHYEQSFMQVFTEALNFHILERGVRIHNAPTPNHRITFWASAVTKHPNALHNHFTEPREIPLNEVTRRMYRALKI